MKFCIVFAVLLLGSLVTADLVPNGPKVLYDSDYVIIEGSGTYRATYSYRGVLHFQFHKEPLSIRDHLDFLVFKGHDLKAQNLSFAIDTYYHDEEALKTDLCSQKSNPDLRKMLMGCSNRTVIRELTHKEKEQLQKFKQEYKETKNPLKLVHNGEQQRFQTQTVELDRFTVKTGHVDKGNLLVQVITTDDSDRLHFMDVLNTAKNTSFAIEGIRSSRGDCHDIGSENLSAITCYGTISARPLQNDPIV